MWDIKFLVEIGQFVKQDELIANIETDKVTIPVNCPESGLLKKLFAKEGDTIEVGSNLFEIDTDAKPTETVKVAEPKTTKETTLSKLFEAPSQPKAQVQTSSTSPGQVKAPNQTSAQVHVGRAERREWKIKWKLH